MPKKIVNKKDAVKDEVVDQTPETPTPEETPETALQDDTPVMDALAHDVLINAVYSDEFAYEVKAGKQVFAGLTDDRVLELVDAVLGTVDKIIITRM